jgi:hypothetical protein
LNFDVKGAGETHLMQNQLWQHHLNIFTPLPSPFFKKGCKEIIM